MFSRDQVVGFLNHLTDSASDKPLIIEGVSGKAETQLINVKVAITKTDNTTKQNLEAQIIYTLKKQGAKSVNVLFTELPDEIKPQEPTILNDPHVIPIAVASGKGGVGKSTVTVNLAVALARLGKRVAVVDCDIYGPSVPSMLGNSNRAEVADEKIIPLQAHGVQFISMQHFKENDDPVIWRGPMLGRMLDVFFNQVRWGKLDYLILDLPPGTGDVAMDVSKYLPKAKELIVTTPHPTASYIAKKAGLQAQRMDHEVIGVIENMSYLEVNGDRQFVFGQGGGENLAKELGTTLLAQIPMGQPADGGSVYEPDSLIGAAYDTMAKHLSTQLAPHSQHSTDFDLNNTSDNCARG